MSRTVPRERAHLYRLAVLAAFVLLVASEFFPAAAAAPDLSCATPMGLELESNANAYLGDSPDPITGLVDTLRLTGAQRTPATMVNFDGRLVLVAEVKVDKPTSFTWAIMAKVHSNVTGWNTTPVWMSSVNTSESYPVGYHIRPATAMLGDKLWIAWTAEGSPLEGPLDRLIVMRSLDHNGTAGPWLVASDTDSNRTNQHPALVASNGSLVLAYSTGDNASDPQGFRLVTRRFDEAQFEPSINVSKTPPGWADVNPSIAADPQGHLYLAWSRINLTATGAKLMFAVNNGTGWGPATEVAEQGEAASGNPGLAFYKGGVFVAYATDYVPDINGTDYDVYWSRYDIAAGSVSAPAEVNPEPSGGDDVGPTLSLVGDDLYVGWATSEDFYYTRGTDPDPVYRVFNGSALGPLIALTNDSDNATDGSPFFIQIGAYLYAHWMWTPPALPGTPRGDSREALRLVSRPTEWFDSAFAIYHFSAVAENGSSRIEVGIAPGDRAPVGARVVLRLADGSIYPMEREGGAYAVWAPIEPTRSDFEVLGCGVPIPSGPGPARPPGDGGEPMCQCEWAYYLVGAAGVVGVAVWLVWRRMGPRREKGA